MKKSVHRVQILDPATGTGTFLAEVVRHIHDTVCKDNAGLWNEYVEADLKPRLNGFELMVAPYTIAHIKLDTVLADLDFDRTDGKRLKVFLADSLEEPSATARDLFNAISVEANEADKVKRDMPVMVVVGNPPYNGESRNNGKWIKRLMDSYKKEPGGKVQLNERNPKWLNDDYVKFIRMAQHYVERNGKGVVSYICPHGFLDNPTFRGMRWHLLHTFDCIYVLNLHGNSKKQEVCPDGSRDENVFNIMQGVCICIFVKNGTKGDADLGKVYYSDLWGTKEYKLQFLQDNDFASVKWTDVKTEEPMFFFVPKNFMGKEVYEKGFAVNELFIKNSVGVVTTKDAFLVSDDKEDIESRLNDLIKMSESELRKKYNLKDTSDWTLDRAKKDIGNVLDTKKICKYDYRPFDKRWVYYSKTPKGIIARPRYEVQKELRNSPPQRKHGTFNMSAECWARMDVSRCI